MNKISKENTPQPPIITTLDTTVPDILISTGCSIHENFPIFLKTTEGTFCCFCHELCEKAKNPINSVIFHAEALKCHCEHDEQKTFFRDLLQQLSLAPKSLRLTLCANFLLESKRKDQVFFDLVEEDTYFFLQKDLENLQKNDFRWLDLAPKEIADRASFLNLFRFSLPLPKIMVFNTNSLENLLPLTFFSRIIENVNYDYGKPVYDNSWDVNTALLDIFTKFYVEKDFVNLNKIDSEHIFSYTPFARQSIRENNIRNEFIRKKYYGEHFNLNKFALKCFEIFVPGCTWLWIKTTHNAHGFSLQICKILTEYGMFNEEELEELKTILYNKIPIFLALEKSIETKANINSKKGFLGNMKEIRQFYCEILISYLYCKQDKEVISMLRRIHSEKLKRKSDLSVSFLEKIIAFNKTILFEEEFGRKMLDFLLGYILSQNKIDNNRIENQKIKNIIGSFLHFFSNVEDPYLISLKLIRYNDYVNYMNFSTGIESEMVPFKIISKNIDEIIMKTMHCSYLYQENLVVKDFITILDKIEQEVHYSNNYNIKSFGNYRNQKLLSISNIFLKFFNIISLYLEEKEFVKNSELLKEFFQKFSMFLQYYFLENYENHCSFFIEERISLLEKIIKQFPLEISQVLKEIFNNNPQVLLAKDFMLKFFMNTFSVLHRQFHQKTELDEFDCLENIMDLLNIFVDWKNLKIFEWIPNNDLIISKELTSNPEYEEFFQYENLENLLEYCCNNQNNDNIIKKDAISEKKSKSLLALHFSFLKLIANITLFRYDESLYNKIRKGFTKEGFRKLINLCGDFYQYKEILMDIFCNVYIDVKNHLINNRSNYYSIKPLEPEYDEDPFVEEEYDKIIEIFIEQIENINQNYQILNEENFSGDPLKNYLNNCIFPGIAKLSNYFLMVSDENLIKLTNFTAHFESLLNCISKNIKKINSIFNKNIKDLTNATLEQTLQNIDNKFKLKRDKIKMRLLPTLILEKITEFISENKLNYGKSKLLTKKNSLKRISFAIKQLDKLANQMRSRKEKILESFNHIKRGKIKLHDGKIDVLKYLIEFYRNYKMTKMSTESEKNIYIASLRNNSNEIQQLTTNFCSFLHNSLIDTWSEDKRTENFLLIECICNSLFIATEAMQTNLYAIMKSTDHNKMLNIIWQEFLNYLSFVKFKTTIDLFWKEAYRIILILIKFHNFLCEDGCSEFKNLMAETKASEKPDEKHYRVDAWMKIFQKLCDNCQWHNNYQANEIAEFQKTNRAHLFPLGRALLEVFTEFCTGPQENVQKKLYIYPYDRYNGILQRYTPDYNSEFYRMKLSLVGFMLSMIEGNDPLIINYHITNFELHNIYKVLINSLKQLYYCYILRQDMQKNINEYHLSMKDYKKMKESFESDKLLSDQLLFQICVKLFSYIKLIGEIKSKYELFLKERIEALLFYKKNKQMMKKSISEEELVAFRFFNRILISVEIQRSKQQPISSYYFPLNPKCFFLSEETKLNFLEEVDRSSIDTKITALIANSKYFKIEMEYSQNRFKKMKYHQFFGSGLQVYILEVVTFLFCVTNNLILLITFDMNIEFPLTSYGKTVFIIGIFEIVLSISAILTFFYINFPVYRKNYEIKYRKERAYKTSLNIVDQMIINLYDSFLTQKVVIFFFHIVFTAVGLTTNYGVITFDLITIISLFPTMKDIVRSITAHYIQLFNILVMAIVLMFAYSFFSHLFYVQYFLDIEPYSGPDLCSSLAHCFLTVIDKAFRNGEGIGALIDTPFYGQDGIGGGDARYYGTLILNISFFLIINIVILNLILAVLVDTFSQLRKQGDMFKNDSQNICFICNLERYHFEKAGIDFEKHRKFEHNIWDYVSFLIIMDEKTEKDCNGIEGELFSKIKNGDYSWIPIRRSKKIECIQEFSGNVTLEDIINKGSEIDKDMEYLRRSSKK